MSLVAGSRTMPLQTELNHDGTTDATELVFPNRMQFRRLVVSPPDFPPRSDIMDQPKDAPKPKGPEKKAAPQNNNMLWYLLGLGVLLLLLVTVWSSQNKLKFEWSNLEKLIVASNPKAPEGTVKYITHIDATTKPPTKYKLDEPEDITIGPTEVTGTVMALEAARRRSEGRPAGRRDAETRARQLQRRSLAQRRSAGRLAG